jgi:hypothetical protein
LRLTGCVAGENSGERGKRLMVRAKAAIEDLVLDSGDFLL